MGSFNSVPDDTVACLGTYPGNCWGAFGTSNTDVDNALQTVETIPPGIISPYTTSTTHRTVIIKYAPPTSAIQILTYIVDSNYIHLCDKFGWSNVDKNASQGYC